jgi:hypothetical protein
VQTRSQRQIDMQEAAPARGPVAAVSEVGQSLAKMPGQIYHAFEDQPTTPDEQELYQKMHGTQEGDPRAAVPAHLALMFKRLVTDSIVESYSKARRLEQLAEKEPIRKRRKR